MADKKESEGEATKRFPEIRKDAVHNRWVIFSPARSRRPSDFKSKSSIPTPADPKSDNCPFCFGNEHLCAPEIFRLQPDSAHWKIRVIQNLYPALSREGDLLPPLQPDCEGQDREEVDDVHKYSSGNGRMMGFGFHDVVIESPLHSAQLVDLPAFEVGDVLLAYKRRIEQLRTYDAIPLFFFRILSIDAAGSTHGVLAAKSLLHLESTLRCKSGNPNAHLADFFDVVAGAGVGGLLAALLFSRGRDGRPLFTAKQALDLVLQNAAKFSRPPPTGLFRRVLRPSKADDLLHKVFGELTLKDTLKAVLIPCYDLSTGAPFLFSRADAVEMDGCDFRMGLDWIGLRKSLIGCV